jgi:hypothetical protein
VLNTPYVLLDDGAPSASLDHRKARAAGAPEAPAGQLGGLRWPPQLASGRPRVEASSLFNPQEDAVDLFGRISATQMKQTGSCTFTYPDFAKAVGLWANIIEREVGGFSDEHGSGAPSSPPRRRAAPAGVRPSGQSAGGGAPAAAEGSQVRLHMRCLNGTHTYIHTLSLSSPLLSPPSHRSSGRHRRLRTAWRRRRSARATSRPPRCAATAPASRSRRRAPELLHPLMLGYTPVP